MSWRNGLLDQAVADAALLGAQPRAGGLDLGRPDSVTRTRVFPVPCGVNPGTPVWGVARWAKHGWSYFWYSDSHVPSRRIRSRLALTARKIVEVVDSDTVRLGLQARPDDLQVGILDDHAGQKHIVGAAVLA